MATWSAMIQNFHASLIALDRLRDFLKSKTKEPRKFYLHQAQGTVYLDLFTILQFKSALRLETRIWRSILI